MIFCLDAVHVRKNLPLEEDDEDVMRKSLSFEFVSSLLEIGFKGRVSAAL
jgi:hypothetical protein